MPSRGCGDSRVPGGVYLESAGSPTGKPVEWFVVDPPLPLDRDSIPKRGVVVTEAGDVLDWVGEKHYPTAREFWEEVRRLGASRRIRPDTPGLDRLKPGSNFIFVHARAIPRVVAERSGDEDLCPKAVLELAEHGYGLTSQDGKIGVLMGQGGLCAPAGFCRTNECVGVHDPGGSSGVFLVVPIRGIAVVSGPKSEITAESLRRIVDLPVDEVEE